MAVNMSCAENAGSPSNAYRECSVHPVSVLDDGHLASKEASRAIKDLVSMAVVCSRGSMRMRRAIM
jgi:hypothetical protein